MPLLARARACALLFTSFACGDIPLEPSAITGAWALETVDGQPVPAVLANDAQRTILLLSGTLALSPDGSYDARQCDLRIDIVEQHSTGGCRSYSGTYRLRIRTLELRPHCSLGQSCFGSMPLVATLDHDRLVLRADPVSPVLGYVRTP